MLAGIKNQFRRPDGFLGGFIGWLMRKGNIVYYKFMFPKFNLPDGAEILEIGYGHGAGINLLYNETKNFKIHGLDFSELMHKNASELNDEGIKNGRINLMHGDFLHFNLPKNKYDMVFCINVVYFWIDLSIPFKKIYELLNEGGCFYFYMKKFAGKPDKDGVFAIHTIEEAEEVLKDAGFKNIQDEYVKGYYIKAFK